MKVLTLFSSRTAPVLYLMRTTCACFTFSSCFETCSFNRMMCINFFDNFTFFAPGKDAGRVRFRLVLDCTGRHGFGRATLALRSWLRASACHDNNSSSSRLNPCMGVWQMTGIGREEGERGPVFASRAC